MRYLPLALGATIGVFATLAGEQVFVPRTAGAQEVRTNGPTVGTSVPGNVQVDPMVVMQGEIDTLKQQVQQLRNDFSNHTHSFQIEGHAEGIQTILACLGQPCSSTTTPVQVLTPNGKPPIVTGTTSGPHVAP